MSVPPPSPSLTQLIGQPVVLDVARPFVYLGILAEIDHKYLILTDADVHDIANYRAVDVGRETFFERAFTPGKEAAASLAFARIIGRDTVLGDLNHLHASLGCPCDQRAAA